MTKLSNAVAMLPVGRFIEHVRTPLYRNAYALMVSAALTSALGMLYWVLAARYYPPEVVGLNSAVISAMLFLVGVAGFSLDGALTRFLPSAGPSSNRLLYVSYLISFLGAILASLVFLVGLRVWSPTLAFLTATPWAALAFVVLVVTSCVFQMQDGALTGLRQATWVATRNGFVALVKVLLLVWFAQSWPDYGILGAWIIPGFLLILPMHGLIMGRLLPQHRATCEAPLVPLQADVVKRYVAGNYLASLFNTAGTMLLPLLVVSLAGSEAGAYFYLPWMITTSLRLVAMSMSMSLTVEGALDERRISKYGRASLRHTVELVGPLVVVLLIGAPFILHLFGRAYAEEGVTLLRLLTLGVIPNIVCVLYVALARVQNHVWRIVAIQGGLAALTLTLSFVGLQRYGIVGVGVAWLVSQSLVAVVILMTQVRRFLRRAS